MDHRMNLFSLLLPLLAFVSIEAAQYPEDPEKLYAGVFELTCSVWDYDRIVDALGKLVGQDGLPVDDPRRSQVEYWIEAGRDEESKCTLEAQQEMMAHLEIDRAKAKEMKRGMYPPRDVDIVFNLENYVNERSLRRFFYCRNTIGRSFIEASDKAILEDRKDLNDLTANRRKNWISDQELGERVAHLLSRKLDPATSERVSKDAGAIKDSYDQVSPCVKVLNVIPEHDSYYRLLTLPGNYERCSFELAYILDRISVCEYIRDSKRVFEFAADYMQKMS